MLYENIVECVRKKQLSIAQVERDLGMGNGTIGGWRSSSPRVATLKRVADYLGVSVDELLSEQ